MLDNLGITARGEPKTFRLSACRLAGRHLCVVVTTGASSDGLLGFAEEVGDQPFAEAGEER